MTLLRGTLWVKWRCRGLTRDGGVGIPKCRQQFVPFMASCNGRSAAAKATSRRCTLTIGTAKVREIDRESRDADGELNVQDVAEALKTVKFYRESNNAPGRKRVNAPRTR